MVFATFLGGSGDDEGLSIAVDTLGDIYIVDCQRNKPYFADNARSRISHRQLDGKNGFVVKLNPTGTAIIYSTLVPGAGQAGVHSPSTIGSRYFAGTIRFDNHSPQAPEPPRRP